MKVPASHLGSAAPPDLVPARMVNEFVYCPRLAYLEWVQGEFADSVDTVEGRFQHRRVDRPAGGLPSAPSDGGGASEETGPGASETIHARSVMLSDETLGVIARIDLVEGLGSVVTPVDYKHGTAPHLPEGAWEPERVQLCLQGLLLRANGYTCAQGMLYFVESKERVTVPFDDGMVSRTLEVLGASRSMAASGLVPPPLVDSPKCPRCSLVGICLPDEVNLLSIGGQSVKPEEVRRMAPARDDALPLYVQTQGAVVGKSGDLLEIRVKGDVLQKVRLMEVSHLALFGNVQITAQSLRELCDRNIPICHFTYGGWFQGITTGMAHKNVDLRLRQYLGATTPEVSLPIARQIVFGKIKNCRTLLRRNHQEPPLAVLAELDRLAERAGAAGSMETLLGLEGAAARAYFSEFQGMLKADGAEFDFRGRNRRPPRDPVNAVLSFLYAMLIKQAMVTALAVGFDPYLGFYHQPKYGKPALALDLAEEFRPLIADSVCLTLINNGELASQDILVRGGMAALNQNGRRKVIDAYERRMDALITHPLFGYTISYRRVMEVQARLLSRHLLGELPSYPVFRTR
ncbi:MAG: CRISPR-associated endonuclease Cas1 [Dehalococcoidia bacterium]|nr:CRISPR-associated endonuclease Cas1 [Dehalococcoidia bacterium]